MELIEALEKIRDTGTEAELTAFVMQHFKEFPEDVRREFALGILEDSIDETLASNESIGTMKKEAVKIIEAIEAAEKEENKN